VGVCGPAGKGLNRRDLCKVSGRRTSHTAIVPTLLTLTPTTGFGRSVPLMVVDAQMWVAL
jgi:hypothetical protein